MPLEGIRAEVDTTDILCESVAPQAFKDYSKDKSISEADWIAETYFQQ